MAELIAIRVLTKEQGEAVKAKVNFFGANPDIQYMINYEIEKKRR